MNDSERVSRLSKMKQQKIESSLKSMYKGMIDKERFNEVIIEAIKSPHTKKLKQKISEIENEIN